jgi:hypothetical protein
LRGGGGGGTGLRAGSTIAFFNCFDFAGLAFAALTGTGFLCCLAGGAGLRAGAFAFGLTLETARLAEGEAARLGGGDLRAGAAFVALPFVCLPLAVALLAAAVEADLVFDLGALRAGALSDAERLTSGLGRAVLPANARFFAEDDVEF